ncbi:hypothetical protein BT69DRAFT_1264358 [Atractiella rhizophila]|nr:hypothetical protein BT69DRAFT_1264358 [Atractiella rhizophila]
MPLHPERQAQVDQAARLQALGAREGMIKWTAIGLVTVTAAHFAFPKFRRQTLAGKAFLVSWFTCFGLCTHAEKYLQVYERQQAIYEREWRTRARADLTRQGIISTETALLKWKSENEP